MCHVTSLIFLYSQPSVMLKLPAQELQTQQQFRTAKCGGILSTFFEVLFVFNCMVSDCIDNCLPICTTQSAVPTSSHWLFLICPTITALCLHEPTRLHVLFLNRRGVQSLYEGQKERAADVLRHEPVSPGSSDVLHVRARRRQTRVRDHAGCMEGT